MPKTKNPIIRYLALDKCFRDTRKRYYMCDLVKACQDALYEHNGSSVEERTVRQDIKDMMREIPYAAPIEKHMDGHEAWYRYSDCDYSIRNLPLTQDEMNLLFSSFKEVRKEQTKFREDNKDSLTSVRNKIDAHRDEDVCMQIETAENLHLSDAVKLILDYGRIVNELGTVVSPMKQLGILRLKSVFHDRNR